MSNSSAAAPNLANILNGDAGSAQSRVGITIQTLAISFAAGAVLFAVQFTAFILIRKAHWSRRIFEPRSFLVPLKNRVERPAWNPFKWIWGVFKTPEQPVIMQKAGMDAYFFLRYLSMCLKIFLPTAFLAIPILLPLNVVDGRSTRLLYGVKNNITGLDKLAWSNVSPAHTDRYWAHCILAVLLVAWVCFIFYTELDHYIQKRQNYLASTSHRLKASSSTVLITDVPADLCTNDSLTAMYDDFPGGIRRIWLNRDYKPLVALVEQRRKIQDLLENAETDLLRKVAKRVKKLPHLKSESEALQPTTSSQDYELGQMSLGSWAEHQPLTPTTVTTPTDPNDTSPAACRADLKRDLDTRAAWARYISPRQRSKMRIPKDTWKWAAKVPLIKYLFTRRIDTIYYCRRELIRLNRVIHSETIRSAEYPQNGTAFIQFNSQKAAHLACQSTAHTRPRKMVRRTLELSPVDINWQNLGLSWLVRYLRFAVFVLLFIVILLVLGLVSVFTGILSRVSTLPGSTAWLNWIHSVPQWLLSFVQGTLPPVIQVILLSGPLPIILRAMTNNVKGDPTGSQGERSLQLWYFTLLVFELFIIPTIAAGLTGVLSELLRFSTSVPQILASNLPKAVNYYYSFLVVQALSISASSMLQTVRLFNFYVLGSYNTPNSVWQRLTFTHYTRIGSNIPWYTTFAVIGLVYAIIAPLMLIFVLFTFSLFWLVVKNNIMYVVRTGLVDGGGLFFPSAINQLFTGLYFMEVCLIGLFFLVRDQHGDVACESQGIIMSVTLALTVCYQAWLSHHLGRLYVHAPVQLEADADARDKEYERARLWDPHSEATSPTLTQRERSPAPRVKIVSPRIRVHPPESEPDSPHSIQVSPQKDSIDSETMDVQRPEPSPMSEKVKTPLSGASTGSQFQRHVSIRSRHVQAQQHRDGQAAKHILARMHRAPGEGPKSATASAYGAGSPGFMPDSVSSLGTPRPTTMTSTLQPPGTPGTPGTLIHSPTDPISRVIMEHNDELEDLSLSERDTLISVAFEHPVLQASTVGPTHLGQPVIWIPTDEYGVSADEIARTKRLSEKFIAIENRGAWFDCKGKVRVDAAPPDMSEFAIVMGDL